MNPSLAETVEALSSAALLADVDDASLERFASILREREFEAGDVVFHQGDQAPSYAIVLEGFLTVTNRDDQGETVWTCSVGPGAVVGEIELSSGSDRTATLEATTHVRLMTGERDTLTEMMGLLGVDDRLNAARSQQLAVHAAPIPTTVKGGLEIWLRPFLPSDRDELGEAITQISERTRRLRFFTGGAVSKRVVDYLANLDYINHFAWVAGLEANGAGIGVVRVIRDATRPAAAELAVAIADDYQGIGVGSMLVGASTVSAEIAQIRVLKASVLSENRPMQTLLDRVGAKWTLAEPGVVATEVPVLRAGSLIADTLAAQLRPVAAATMAAATVPIRGGLIRPRMGIDPGA